MSIIIKIGNQFQIVKIELLKFCFIGTMIFGTLAWTIELYMTNTYIIGEIFSSGRATLYKNPSDQTECSPPAAPINSATGIAEHLICGTHSFWLVSSLLSF